MKPQSMDNNRYSEAYKELIFGYLTSSLSEDEGELLKNWLNEDSANKKYFDECHEVWLASKLKTAQKDFDSRKAFQRFKKHIKLSSPDKSHSRRLVIPISKAVAALFIPFFVGFFANSFLNKKTQNVTYYEVNVPAGSKTNLKLPDGTEVWLNSQSKLVYANDYNVTNREVKLEGEGYFKVAHDKNHPFLVNTSKITIRALGTEFNVKCYADEGLIETTLVNGSVKIEEKEKPRKGKLSKGLKSIVLKPNQKLTFIKQSGKIYLNSDTLQAEQNNTQTRSTALVEAMRKEEMIVRHIDPTPLIAWKEHKLIFTGERFEEVKTKLERWYGVSIDIKDKEILSYRFKGSFEKETLEQALDALKLAAHFRYSIDKNHVEITK